MLKKEIYDFYIPIIRKYKSLFLLMWIGWIISGTSSVVMPLLLKLETDQLVAKHSYTFFSQTLSPFEVFVVILGVILFVDIFQTLLSSLTNIFAQSKEDLLKNEIQLQLFEKMQHMEVGRTMSSRYKYISSIVESDFPSISRRIIDLPGGTLDFLIKFFWFTAMYIYFDTTLLLVVVASSIIGYLIEIFARKVRAKYDIDWKFTLGRQVRKYSNLFLYQFSQLAVSGGLISTLQSYQTLLNKENQNTQKRNFSDLFWNIQNLLNNNVRDIILKLLVWYWVFAGTKSVGMVVLVVSSMGSIGEMISKIFSLKPAYKDFLFQQESILLMLKICTPAGTRDFNEKINSMSMQWLTFSYPNMAKYEKEYMEILQKNIIGKDLKNNRLDKQIKELIDVMSEESQVEFPDIFSGVDLEFQKGKVYGIVGKNGAGKTSLMYLLAWFFRSYTGNISFNGQDTRDLTTKSFLQKVSFLTQIPFVLDWMSDIEENLFLWADKSKKEKLAWEYLEKFGLDKKIKKHKKQLKAEIGNDIEFSGGEKQLIAFIRLLLQDRDIIILDEGTNQLDAENEVLVMNELLSQKKDKIIIFITHRMSTISKADEIYCLEDGHITAKGNHKELLTLWNNAYARFYKTQVLHEEGI